MRVSGFGETQRRILFILKQEGGATTHELASSLTLNPESIRGHLKALRVEGVVQQVGTRKDGPGRPEIVFGLTGEAQRLFPNNEGDILRALVAHLLERGDEETLHEFLRSCVRGKQAMSLKRLANNQGRARWEEAATILSEMGFMARIEDAPSGDARLRISHCPLRRLVEVTDLPCKLEAQALTESLGVEVSRCHHQLSGDSSCLYEWTPRDR